MVHAFCCGEAAAAGGPGIRAPYEMDFVPGEGCCKMALKVASDYDEALTLNLTFGSDALKRHPMLCQKKEKKKKPLKW